MNEFPVYPATCLDTSFVVSALFARSPHHATARQHYHRLATDQTVAIFSDLLKVELLQALRTIANDPTGLAGSTRRRYRLQHWAASEEIRVQWLRHGLNLFDLFIAEFAAAYVIPIDGDILEQSLRMMARYQLRSYDAMHIATAIAAGAPAVVTVDADFARVTELDVHLLRSTE